MNFFRKRPSHVKKYFGQAPDLPLHLVDSPKSAFWCRDMNFDLQIERSDIPIY